METNAGMKICTVNISHAELFELIVLVTAETKRKRRKHKQAYMYDLLDKLAEQMESQVTVDELHMAAHEYNIKELFK